MYLKYFRDFHLGILSKKKYSKRINYLRKIGYYRKYVFQNQFPLNWKYDGIPAKEVVVAISYRKSFRKTKKTEVYVKRYCRFEQNIIHVKIIKGGYVYRDENLNLIKKKFNKLIGPNLLFNDYPLIEGNYYKMFYDSKKIVNHKDNSEKWKKEAVKKYKEKINKFNKEIKGIEGPFSETPIKVK